MFISVTISFKMVYVLDFFLKKASTSHSLLPPWPQAFCSFQDTVVFPFFIPIATRPSSFLFEPKSSDALDSNKTTKFTEEVWSYMCRL